VEKDNKGHADVRLINVKRMVASYRRPTRYAPRKFAFSTTRHSIAERILVGQFHKKARFHKDRAISQPTLRLRLQTGVKVHVVVVMAVSHRRELFAISCDEH